MWCKTVSPKWCSMGTVEMCHEFPLHEEVNAFFPHLALYAWSINSTNVCIYSSGSLPLLLLPLSTPRKPLCQPPMLQQHALLTSGHVDGQTKTSLCFVARLIPSTSPHVPRDDRRGSKGSHQSARSCRSNLSSGHCVCPLRYRPEKLAGSRSRKKRA